MEGQLSRATGARGPLAGEVRRDADVAAYREAVTGLLAELVGPSRYLTVETAERLLNRRLREPVFAAVFSALPKGPDAAIRRVIDEVRGYRASACSSAENLPAMIRIALLAQIDLLWWGHLPEYQTDAHVFGARQLLHLDVRRQLLGDALGSLLRACRRRRQGYSQRETRALQHSYDCSFHASAQ